MVNDLNRTILLLDVGSFSKSVYLTYLCDPGDVANTSKLCQMEVTLNGLFDNSLEWNFLAAKVTI